MANATNEVNPERGVSGKPSELEKVMAMNGRGLSHTTTVDCAPLSDEAPPQKDDEELQRWAELVATCLTPTVGQTHTLPGLGSPEAEGTLPDGWRPSVGELTLGERKSSFSAGSAQGTTVGSESSSDEVTRIQVRINTKEFGEVSVVIERAEQGLRISLGALDERVASALRLEVLAVRRALESGGQTVNSLEIVRMNQVGTDLARTPLTTGNRAKRSRDTEQSTSNPGSRKKTRRINLIG